jgi:hypothetical protein
MVLCGCAPLAVRTYPAPTPAQLVDHLRSRQLSLQSIRAQAKADFLSGKDRIKVSIAVLAARPDRLRLAAESAFTGPLLTLATDGSSFELLDVQKNRYLSGPVSPCIIARLIRVELKPQEVVDTLLGGVALFEQPRTTTVSFDGHDGGREVLTLTAADGRTEVVRLSAEGRTWDVREAEFRDPAGRPLLRISHKGFSALSKAAPAQGPAQREVRLPSETLIEDLPRKSDVRLRWKERELDPVLPDSVFRLEAPPGVPMEAATCSG